MSRRLLGYIVKLPDGARSSLLAGPASLLTARKVVAEQAPVGAYVCPVFAVRKPKPRPRVRLGEWAGSPEAAASVTGPAPVVEAAVREAFAAAAKVVRDTRGEMDERNESSGMDMLASIADAIEELGEEWDEAAKGQAK